MCSHPSYGQEVKGLRIFHGFSNMEVLGNLGKGYFGEVMGVKVVKEILEIQGKEDQEGEWTKEMYLEVVWAT